MSRIHPLEGHHQVPVEVERGALARPEVRVVDSLLRHWMKHVVKAEFVVKLTSTPSTRMRAGVPAMKGLGTGGHRSFAPAAPAPAFVARFPQVQTASSRHITAKPPSW
jgi:hypothetical protein